MLSAAICGGVFASPSVDSILAGIRTVTGNRGCLLIVKNYTGDRLNFGLAAEQAKTEGYNVAMVIVGDDVAVNAGEESDGSIVGRRGLAGTLFVHKCAGAAAASGASLEQVLAEADATAACVGSMGVAMTTCTLPGMVPSDRIGADEMEVGLGIHGEPGRLKTKREPVDKIVARLVDQIAAVMKPSPGQRVVIMVNNLGGTPLLELYVFARAVHTILKEKLKCCVERSFVGSFMTSLEMAGAMLTVLIVDDLRLARVDAPTEAPAWPRVPANFATNHSNRDIEPAVAQAPSTTHKTSIELSSEAQGEARKKAIVNAMNAVIAAEEELTNYDKIVGDGDCGLTLKRGAEQVLKDVAAYDCRDSAGALCAISTSLRTAMGGSSGAIIDIMLRAGANHLQKAGPDDWPGALQAATQSASFYGGAKVGCRTMLDALIPAAEAATKSQSWAGVLEAAERGAKATTLMKPLAGRSSYLEQSLTDGTPDPGAIAAVYVLKALSSQ
jgi:dihydroxyacetone kinase